MNVFLAELRQVIIPDRDGKHGPLPPLLVTMTVVTGLVDAFSYLVLGHVFVANMTGNVVFLAFALAGAPGFSLLAAVLALAAFALGALAGGGLASRPGTTAGGCSAAPPPSRSCCSWPRWCSPSSRPAPCRPVSVTA